MLLYNTHDNKYLNLSLDIFERSKISFLFQNVLREINTLNRLYKTKFRYYIELQRVSKNHILKDKFQVLLYTHRNFTYMIVTTSHVNPYKYHNQSIVKSYHNTIVYKYMILPLGKIRIKNFKVNLCSDYIL